MNNALRIEIQENAVKFRDENGYSASEPIQLSSLLLKKNIITVFKPLSDKLSGMAIKAPGDIRFMLINRKHIIGKQHFTIGHELYHLFIQENFTTQKCNTGLFEKQTDIEEKKADYFAACLLLPEYGIKQLVPTDERQKKNLISDVTIFKIQQYYRLSIDSVIYRLVELGFVDKTYFEKYKNEKKAIARKLGYDMGLFEPRTEDKFFGNYGIIANELFKNKKISESFYLELLNAVNIDPFVTSTDE